MLCDPNYQSTMYKPTDFVKSSFLYRTAPMYVTDQPAFWNGAVEITTDLDPHTLLRRLKSIEQDMGRNASSNILRNGPRPLDLDILLYYHSRSDANSTDKDEEAILIETKDLEIPHPRLHEREFVLGPLVEVAGRDLIHPTLSTIAKMSIGELLDDITNSPLGHPTGTEQTIPPAVRLVPLPRQRFLLFDKTLIMGILNVTPDSFSDGGKWTSVERAVKHAIEMIDDGATILDIGGESTRPGATEVSVEEQIRRTVPVIEAIRRSGKEGIVLSIDTRHAAVARAAVEAGADIVNDVSGGTFDPAMLSTVAELRVPIILMHMRGTPESMQKLTSYEDQGGVVESVVNALLQCSQAAEEGGIPRWMQILDPGIGFAKDLKGNLSLLKHYSEMRLKLGDFPLLLGTSRKGFIGHISGETVAEERDFGTVGSCVTALCLGNGSRNFNIGCNILRVHNVKGARQAASVMDAIINAQ
jgi:dihydropteroate synthase/2-amino-4-hydroxy-6-hydroxymethyldihydropteridine diphosphokinase